ncbi:MAG: helix-turn-helix domain-containing protein [Chitinivibrionales bacterium]|nr:helix-turn-helix domain-containing protein [Chitinivibrionales bacterium]
MPRKRIDRIYSQIGTRIREIRKAKGLSQEDLAKEVSLERPSIVLIESGRQKLPIDRLYAIARVLEVQPQDLLPSLSDIFGENGDAPVFVHGGVVMEERAIYEIREIVEKKKKQQKRKAKQ